jgi:hypothetical protein
MNKPDLGSVIGIITKSARKHVKPANVEIDGMESIVGKTWIHVPYFNSEGRLTYEHRKELTDVTPAEFMSWIQYTDPTLTDEVSEDRFTTTADRTRWFMGVVARHKKLKDNPIGIKESNERKLS